jgi:hypothetical protein
MEYMVVMNPITQHRRKHMTETIDLTPRGMQTPEGAERVRIAIQKFENATALLANAATEFLDEYGGILDDAAEEDVVGRGDFAEDLKGLRKLIERRQREQEQFLRAVAGAPEVK